MPLAGARVLEGTPSAAPAPARADRAALQQLLAGMCDEFAAKLPAKLVHIESLWRETIGGDDSRREELLRTVHSIAGSAATFGLRGVGDAALELERILQPLCRRSVIPGAEEQAGVNAGLARLLRVSAHRDT